MTRVLRTALIALTLVFFVAAVATQWSKLSDFDWHFAPLPLVLGIVAFAAMQQLHAELWRQLLSGLGHPLPARQGWAVWNVSLLGRYVPTSVLMATGRMSLAARGGVPRRVTILSVLYEVALSLTGASVLVVVFLFTVPGSPGWLRLAALALPVGGLIAMHPRIFHFISDGALRRLKLDPLPARLPPRIAYGLVSGYAVSFVFAGLGTLAVVATLTPVSRDDAAAAISAYAIGYGVSIMGFMLPAGLGIRETGLAGALATVVPLGVATIASVLVRLVQLGLEAAFALVSSLLSRGLVPFALPKRKGDRSEVSPSSHP